MSDVPDLRHLEFELERRAAKPSVPAVDRNRSRGLDLTPEERIARRRNRRWMLGLAIPSVIVLAAALVASQVSWNNEPRGPAITAPAGYKALNDGYFSYVVPVGWNQDPANTDSAGDVDTSGPTGWAGEHIGYRTSAPVLGEAPPVSLRAFGVARPSRFDLVGGHPVAVKGAAAISYTATRPDGFRATVIDAWDARAGVELWLMVNAPAPITEQVLESLQA